MDILSHTDPTLSVVPNKDLLALLQGHLAYLESISSNPLINNDIVDKTYLINKKYHLSLKIEALQARIKASSINSIINTNEE